MRAGLRTALQRCGTSFGNTLVHFVNHSLPEAVDIKQDDVGFMQRYPAAT